MVKVWKKITNSNFNPRHDFEKNPTLEGVLVGTRKNVGPKGLTFHTIETSKGEVDILGSAVLNNALEGLDDCPVRITYLGTKPSKKWPQPTKIFEVEAEVEFEDVPRDDEGNEVSE